MDKTCAMRLPLLLAALIASAQASGHSVVDKRLGKTAEHAVFIAKVPAELYGKQIAAAIELEARSADEVERELGAADAF